MVILGFQMWPTHVTFPQNGAYIWSEYKCPLNLFGLLLRALAGRHAGRALYTLAEQPSVQVLLQIYLNSLQYQLTLSIMCVYSPVGFILIGTRHKTWGRTSVGILTTILVVRGVTPLTPMYGLRSVAYPSAQRVSLSQRSYLRDVIYLVQKLRFEHVVRQFSCPKFCLRLHSFICLSSLIQPIYN